MPTPSVSFLLGVVVLGYLLSFVVFAILRILTGVSVQRLGYSGFRRISFSPRHGVKINIRGVGLSIHRPTFALPTWCSLVITELYVSVDVKALRDGQQEKKGLFGQANGTTKHSGEKDAGSEKSREAQDGVDDGHGKTWRQLTKVKEKIKRLHAQIDWIKMVDFIAVSTTLNIQGVGSFALERASLSVDTRSRTMGRFFQHYARGTDEQRPAEWKSMIRSLLFTPEGRESTELLDYGTLNVSGVLFKELAGLRDASISLKLGRVNVPYDDIVYAKTCADLLLGKYGQPHGGRSDQDVTLADAIDELEKPGTREERIVQTVSDSREFIASILRGIQEVQLAFGFLGLSKKLDTKGHNGNDVFLNVAMKEMGLDVMRLDPRSPAHRMYFPTKDAAHQGLLTAIAISAGIDDGHDHPERMFYVPMVTATVKTTLPSKTIQNPGSSDAGERNTNMLFANLVCTSPSVDLDPKHLPLVLNMLESRAEPKGSQATKDNGGHNLISRLLPKASIKFSVQEPVIRVSLPPMNKDNVEDGDYDLLISSVSTMSFDLDSYHSTGGNTHYRLSSNYRQTNHQLYYQTSCGERHDLLRSDTVELKVNVNAVPEANVIVSGRFQTFAIFLVRPEICEGLRQIVRQLRHHVLAQPEKQQKKKKLSFLRSMPAWLEHVKVEGSNFSVELAGVDDQVSKEQRGLSLELESWTTEYKARRDDSVEKHGHRSSASVSSASPGKRRKHRSRSSSPRKKPESLGDGRRLTLHVENLEGLIVDLPGADTPERFMALPRFEIALTTSTDTQGPLFHVNSFAKSLFLQYSLYNHYAMGVAAMVVKDTFLGHEQDEHRESIRDHAPGIATLTVPKETNTAANEVASREITTVDFKTGLLQLKAKMPADPPMMLQIFGLEAGRHRWATPFLRSRLARLCVRAPTMKTVWSRVLSIKTVRVDVRDVKRRHAKSVTEEKSIDLFAEIIRIGIPHQLVVHSIFDNITNVVKTGKQLQHHFVTGTNEYILTKEPESPKRVPKINLRSQLFLFEIEDSSFEWKLNAIYRAGLLEQKQRLARDEAFKMKEKHLTRHANRGSSRIRAKSTTPANRSRSRARQGSVSGPRRSHSQQPSSRDSPPSTKQNSRRKVRYDTEGKCGFADASPLSVAQAKDKLHRLNAQTWKSRIDLVLSFQSHAIRDIRKMFWGIDEAGDESEQQEPILALSQRPALATVFFSELAVTIDKPSFPIEDFPGFLNDVGKGMPMDMQYGLLLPMNLHITTGEARIQLRDYPLPVLHVPPIAYGQSARLPALSLKTDFVIAEEFRDIESQRSVNVMVVPPEKMGDKAKKGFAIDVRRTISPVKTYSDMKFEINTSSPTRITWGTSYQPAIQDAMQVIEGFTKPPVDTSDRVGFWDKIRLSFHSRVNVAWKGDGDVHLCLKGSRDPYVVTGQGAGFVMVWRNDVRWNIAQHEDPRQFMSVDSGDYLLAVPDFSHYARVSDSRQDEDDGNSSSNSYRKGAVFKKVVMKLSGKVKWVAGLMFERELPNGKRTFEFKNHYDIVLKHPDFAKAPSGETYDAFKGFRSQHIHMSIAIAAPHDRDWSVSNLKPSKNYNSIHLSPRFFSHFFSWWSMFSGIMSLPVRQGPLWGVTEKKSKKFGRHVSTIKYNLLLSPLFISHIYKHKDAEDYKEDYVSATGLKLRLDSFMLDLHQRREHFDIQGHGDAGPKKSSGMRINQAQLDFISADMRAVSASIAGTSANDIDKASDESLALLQEQVPPVDMSKFTIPDNDFTWIDMDDFVELDWILPAESNPETKILPLGYAPRFTYFRQTDHGDSISGDVSRSSPFGDEPTHYCVMSAKNDPRLVQAEIIQQRLVMIREQKAQNERAVSDAELKAVRDVNGESAQEKLKTLRVHTETLRNKYNFLESILKTITEKLEQDDPSAVPELETTEEFFEAHSDSKQDEGLRSNLDQAPLDDNSSDFNNRFVVHNAQIKWNNSLRNIILRYIHQVSQRRGFVYYMSRRAVKFILDIVEEKQHSGRQGDAKRSKSDATAESMKSPDLDDDATVQDRIEQLLQDGRNFVNADDEPDLAEKQAEESKSNTNGPTDEIAVEFTPLNTYHFRLIAPQIQLQSEKNARSAVLVTAKGMQLKVVQIMDKGRVTDEVSGLVQRRFTAAMDSLQMYVTSTKTFSTEYLHMYSGNRYGAKAGSLWPPWVPVEVMFEYQAHPYGFNRVVHRTSASLRYDKYNTLRLKYNDDVSGGRSNGQQSDGDSDNHMDHVWLEFPQFIAVCDSAQYYAMYIIVMDLLLYNEPLEKTRSERLEKIMLASDFSDLTGAPEMVGLLQERIRQLEEIKMHFQVNERYLDRQGWKDRITLDRDLASCEDELFFMMKAITTSQQRLEDRREHDNANGMLHLSMTAKEIAWHLVRDEGESLVEFQLKEASYDRTDNNDGSNHNVIGISRINGFNLLSDALYPEMIAPYVDESRGFHQLGGSKMLRVQWLMLEDIAGIPVVDYFEIDLVPLKLQLEREVAKKLFEYIFPGVGGNAFEGGGFSPFMVKNMLPTQEEDDEENENESALPVGPSAPGAKVAGLANAVPDPSQPTGNGAGALEVRLKPTLNLPKQRRPKKDLQGLGISSSHHNLHGFGLFQQSDRSRNTSAQRPATARAALSSSPSLAMSRSPSERSLATMSANGSADGDTKRFGVGRSASDKKRKDNKETPSDDLTQMMNRASNYMTLAFVKVPSMVLCLSYKGKGHRNIEDVHNLVFRMPTLEYRNKTWSNLDLALQLKKDVIRALISHAGAIVGNKFSHHKPSRQQTSKLREIANMSSLMALPSNSGQSSETHSNRELNGETDGRPSTASARPSSLGRTLSLGESSMQSRSTTDLPNDGDDIGSEHGSPHGRRRGSNGGLSGGFITARQSPQPPGTPEGEVSTSTMAASNVKQDANSPKQSPRNRTASISRRFTGLSQRLRQSDSNGNGSIDEPPVDDKDSNRRSKFISGGQRLLRGFRDQ